jgi:hypothetical protein
MHLDGKRVQLLNVQIETENIETFEHIDGGTRQALAFKALADESNSLALLNRYETRIRRSCESAMRELRRRIAERTQPEPTQPNMPIRAATAKERFPRTSQTNPPNEPTPPRGRSSPARGSQPRKYNEPPALPVVYFS